MQAGEKRCALLGLLGVALGLSMVLGCCTALPYPFSAHATCREDIVGRFMLLRCLVSGASLCVFVCIGALAAVCFVVTRGRRPFPVTIPLVALLLHAGAMLSFGLPVLSGAVSYPYCEAGMWQEEDDALSQQQPPLWAYVELLPIALLVISDCLIAVFSTVALVIDL